MAPRPSRSRGTKAVLFLDDQGQQGALFDAFAATLRRRGLRTVRLTFRGPTAARRLRDVLFYSSVIRLSGDDGADTLRRSLAGYDVVDVQFGEATLARLGLASDLVRTLAEMALSCVHAVPLAVYDKFELNARLARAGMLAPPQILASCAAAGAAADRLGLPIVVKRRVAEGGRGVHLAETADEAEKVLAKWRTPRDQAFFQKRIPGELVMYGALVTDHGPLVERCFRATQLQTRWGPSARVAMHDDPEVIRAGRAITATLGLRGLAQFDFIKDPAGRLWHIDANARCWGSMLSAAAHGGDFVTAYARLAQGLSPAPTAAPTAEVEFSIQPHGFLAAAATRSLRVWCEAGREFVTFCRLGPGWAYAALHLVKALGAAANREGRARP